MEFLNEAAPNSNGPLFHVYITSTQTQANNHLQRVYNVLYTTTAFCPNAQGLSLAAEGREYAVSLEEGFEGACLEHDSDSLLRP